MISQNSIDLHLFGDYKEFVSDGMWDYFLNEYKKRGWRSYPSDLPYMTSKEEVDDWLNQTEKKINAIVEQLGLGKE